MAWPGTVRLALMNVVVQHTVHDVSWINMPFKATEDLVFKFKAAMCQIFYRFFLHACSFQSLPELSDEYS